MNKSALQDRLSSVLHPTREQVVRILLTLLVMFIPLFMALILTGIRGQNIFQAVPRWNDETWWYAQYAAISEYGRPLGYFGYAGTHAHTGTWGPWGVFPLLVTGLLARIFGWGLHAFVYYNFLLLALSALIFILLTKPSNRSLVMLAAINGLMYITICYSTICMNEVVRYAMAIVLAGIMYRLIMTPDVSRTRMILRCTLIPLLLAYATCFYVILGAFIPVYLFIMLRNWKLVWRTLVSVPVSAVVIRFLQNLNGTTAAPYIPNQGGISFAPPTLKLKILDFYYTTLNNVINIDPFHLLLETEPTDSTPVLLWFCVLLYVLMGLLIWRLHTTAKVPEKKNLLAVQAMCLFLLLAFWGGHILLYNTTDWTFIRGCNTAVSCVLFLTALMPRGESQVWRGGLIVSIVGIFTFIAIFTTEFSASSRFSTPAQDAQWAQEKAVLEEVIQLDKTAEDPWSNTVVLCGTETDIYYTLPYGAGVNGYVSGSINENARYVIVGYDYSDMENREADLQILLDSGHEIIYECEDYVVLENQAKTFG